MRIRMWTPILILAAGAALVGLSVATGEAEVHLLLIFPLFTGSGLAFLLGVSLILAGFLISFFMIATGRIHADQIPQRLGDEGILGQTDKKVDYGGAVLIGPVPIAFGSSKGIAVVMMIVALTLAAAILIAFLLLL